MDKMLKISLVTLLTILILCEPLVAVHYAPATDEKLLTNDKRSETKPDSRKKNPTGKKKKEFDSAKGKEDLTAAAKKAPKKRLPVYPAELEGQSATRLPDGKWLLLGGNKDGEIISTAIIYDEESKAKDVISAGMINPRFGHAATVLPNGSVLILGGKGAKASQIPSPEVFDPKEGKFEERQIINLFPRFGHTATLLTDGWLLITGGKGIDGNLIPQTERLNSGQFERQLVKGKMQGARTDHTAELQADGTVQLKGGFDQNGAEVTFAESYHPDSQVFSISTERPAADQYEMPKISFSDPANGDSSVSIELPLVIRFSKLIDLRTINAQNITLTGDEGSIPIRSVGAESGRLLFIRPFKKLAPNSTYNLKLKGITDQHKLLLEELTLVFKTEEYCELPQTDTQPIPPPVKTNPAQPQVIDEDSWIPGDDRFKDERSKEKQDKTPALEASKGMTALSGRVRSISGKPLPNAMLMIQGQSVFTDNEGRFLLSGLKPQQSGLVIHGETVNSPGKTFGTFEVLVDIDEGKTNVLPYTIYLPVIDKQSEVTLAAPTAKETIVTTPRVPGMELKIAADSVLKMPPGHGMSHNLAELNRDMEMTRIGITPIPVERPPFPLPPGIETGLLFTLQMHGAQVTGPNGEKRPGLRFTFPNYEQLSPESRVSFWNYDSTKAGWTWYGYGTVNKEGTRVIPDPNVELSGMQCLSMMSSWFWAPNGPPPGSHGQDGDPVDLQTGLFVYEQTDLVLPDTMPISVTRTYRQNAGENSFGVGATHPYNMYIAGNTSTYGSLILPDGSRIKFDRDFSVTTHQLYRHTETPTEFYKAELRYLTYPEIDFENGGWEIKMRDGTRMIFARKSIRGSILGIHESATALHQIIDRFGNKMTFTRDENLRLLRVISPHNKWIEFSYIAPGSNIVSQIRDNIGRTVGYTYDAQNRLTKVTDAMGGESFYSYDGAHRMIEMRDARNIVNLTNEYDASGRVKKQTLADGTTYRFAYTMDQNLTKVIQTDVTNPRGLVRRMNFNDKGFPTSEIFGVGRSDAWGFTYERESVSNRLIRSTDSWNRKTFFTYDQNGNILNTTYLEGTADELTTSATFTDFDNISSVTDALDRTSNFTYDNKGLLTNAKDWLDRESSFTYNDKGQVITATDNLNRTSRFKYERGTLVESEDPIGRKMRQYVDSAGRVTRVYDPMGGVKKFRYNKHNRPIHGTDALGRTGALLHDAVGNILEITDSRGGKLKYTYDSMSRPLTRTNQLNQVETYQYDAYGNLWKHTDFKNQVTEFTYDVFNRPTLVKYHDNSTTGYTYDEKGRVSSVTDSASGMITYGYDSRDNVTSEITSGGTVTYGYDAVGRPVSMKAPNQPLITYVYDTADRVQSITQDNQTVSFTYDSNDRRETMTYPNGIVAYYTYDTVSRLKTMVYKLGSTVLGDVGFEYDSNGRKTNVSGSLAQILSPTPFANGSYDASNKQNSINSQSLTYDQNGNLTSDGTNTYTWNARDELVSMSGPNLTASFQYDGEGRRISKTINGITTNFGYDGYQVVEEQMTSGPLTTLLAGGLDEVFYRKATDGANTNFEYLLTDALGSTWGLADSSGNVNTQYKYDIFGQTQASGQSSTTNNSLQYTGRENDATGLYYYRNRYYSPSLRRFISRDPLKEVAGENEYSYVSNNPISLKDPFGLDSEDGYTLQEVTEEYTDYVEIGTEIVKELSGINDIVESVQTLGNPCASLSEKLWAGANLAMELPIPFMKIFKAVKMFRKFWKRIPCGRMTKWLGKCFVAGTLVHTKNGLKSIEEIKVGDEVLSYNEGNGEVEYQKVVTTFSNSSSNLFEINIEGEIKPLIVTNGHPFYVYRARSNLLGKDDKEGAWIHSDKLQAGDEVLRPDGSWVKVLAVNRVEDEAAVYNFEVEQNHNYFVGSNGVLVHNETECSKIAMDEYKKVGGKIIRMDPPKGFNYVDKPKGLYPNTGQWDYHEVHISNKGMVFDKLSKYGEQRIPLEQWTKHFEDSMNIFSRKK